MCLVSKTMTGALSSVVCISSYLGKMPLSGIHGPTKSRLAHCSSKHFSTQICSDWLRRLGYILPFPTALYWKKYIVWIIYLATSSVLACAISSQSTRISCEKAGVGYASSHVSNSTGTSCKMYRFYVGLGFQNEGLAEWALPRQIWIHRKSRDCSQNIRRA